MGERFSYICFCTYYKFYEHLHHIFCLHVWINDTFVGIGHHKQVNFVLGNLSHFHWLGMVTTSSGEHIPTVFWDH